MRLTPKIIPKNPPTSATDNNNFMTNNILQTCLTPEVNNDFLTVSSVMSTFLGKMRRILASSLSSLLYLKLAMTLITCTTSRCRCECHQGVHLAGDRTRVVICIAMVHVVRGCFSAQIRTTNGVLFLTEHFPDYGKFFKK